MLVLLSPAKTLDYESPLSVKEHTQPRFLNHSQELIDGLRKYNAKRVGRLMNLSEKLSHLNVDRYQSWGQPLATDTARQSARQSMLAFKGDVYIGLDAYSLDKRDVNFAQKHLRILSGLYGVLRPLDLIQPHRLEMGTELKTRRGSDLYTFWGNEITDSLNAELEQHRTALVVNLASQEYFRSVKTDALDARLVTPVFKDQKNGEYKIISFFAKKARGMMARYIIQNRIKTVSGLKKFNSSGYRFQANLSDKDELIFTREENWAEV